MTSSDRGSSPLKGLEDLAFWPAGEESAAGNAVEGGKGEHSEEMDEAWHTQRGAVKNERYF